jgi:dipeptidyl aminopeptidase/acylaminoacyl peptidase
LDGKITRFVHQDGQWKKGRSFSVPVTGFTRLVSNGEVVIGDMQSSTVPPELFSFDPNEAKVRVLQKLNPQFSQLALATVKNVSWQTSTGRKVDGTLLLPPDFVQGREYPLVIQTKPYSGNWFVCDQGPGHFPSFIPQPLASAGIAYLGYYYPDIHDGKGLEAYYPKGFPGGVAEAAFETDVYDSAVETLAHEGFIDPHRVGIIGFSRSGWYTMFALMNGKTRYKAATAVDNVNYSFSEFALEPLIGLSSQTTSSIYGGPPSGPTLKNWLDYSISFNLEKIHTPLLMEEMGYGTSFDKRFAPPIFVAMPFEVFGGLSQLHKPVEFYYYPNEEHQPDHPQARLANMQRNLDWYRFWLQGYERPNPEDPNQYKRWEELRTLQERDNANSRLSH